MHYGDIRKLDGGELPPVDCITGGSPCQDLSVAGNREGLAGERSVLFMEQVRIVKEMREHDRRDGRPDQLARPRYMVWENVPGAFSSNGGKDFQRVLTEIVRVAEPEAPDVPLPKGIYGGKWPKAGCLYGDVGGWSVAWRVHDAQFWGVPQRRKRIALVADFGGLTAPEILFERKGMSWDPPEGGEAGEGAAGGAGGGPEGAGGNAIASAWPEIAHTLCARNDGSPRPDKGSGANIVCVNPWDAQSGRVYSGDGAWRSPSGNSGGGQIRDSVLAHEPIPINTMVATREGEEKRTAFGVGDPGDPQFTISAAHEHAVFCLQGNVVDCADTAGCNGKGWTEDVCYTLNTVDRPAVAAFMQNQGGIAILQDVESVHQNASGEVNTANVAYSLSTNGNASGRNAPIICAGFSMGQSAKAGGIGFQEEISPTIRGGEGSNQKPCVFDARGNDDGNVVPTLTGDHESRVTDYTAICVGNGQLNNISMAEQVNTLDTMHDQQMVTASVGRRNFTENQEINGTLQAKPNGGTSANRNNVCRQGPTVRRLTPLECTRLQGFPDGWVDIGDWTDSKGKRHREADAPKYRALGNSIALPFWFWLLRRISAQYGRPATLGSLFDGIGGFPLCWERCNGKGTALWASEIDEFCMAVTRRRFGEDGAPPHSMGCRTGRAASRGGEGSCDGSGVGATGWTSTSSSPPTTTR